jgi:hypothetical protein
MPGVNLTPGWLELGDTSTYSPGLMFQVWACFQARLQWRSCNSMLTAAAVGPCLPWCHPSTTMCCCGMEALGTLQTNSSKADSTALCVGLKHPPGQQLRNLQ